MGPLTEDNEDNEGFQVGWSRIFVSFVTFCKNSFFSKARFGCVRLLLLDLLRAKSFEKSRL